MNMLVPGVHARESWFDLLDQRRFTIGNEQWTAHVAGVHVAGVDRFEQRPRPRGAGGEHGDCAGAEVCR